MKRSINIFEGVVSVDDSKGSVEIVKNEHNNVLWLFFVADFSKNKIRKIYHNIQTKQEKYIDGVFAGGSYLRVRETATENVLFFEGTATGEQLQGDLENRILINNILENLYLDRPDLIPIPVYCFEPFAVAEKWAFRNPLEVSFSVAENGLTVLVNNAKEGSEYVYKVGNGNYQQLPLFVGLTGVNELIVKDVTQSTLLGVDVLGSLKIDLSE